MRTRTVVLSILVLAAAVGSVVGVRFFGDGSLGKVLGILMATIAAVETALAVRLATVQSKRRLPIVAHALSAVGFFLAGYASVRPDPTILALAGTALYSVGLLLLVKDHHAAAELTLRSIQSQSQFPGH